MFKYFWLRCLVHTDKPQGCVELWMDKAAIYVMVLAIDTLLSEERLRCPKVFYMNRQH